MKNPEEILRALEKYNLQGFSHTNDSLISHLTGTYDHLKRWGCREDLCIAGLCHSIYGTESYRRDPIEISERESIQEIIGHNAEKLAYYFGAHVKDSLWENLERDSNFRIFDRLENVEKSISLNELIDLITLTLANWLEQRPRASKEYLFVRKDEFLKSKDLLPAIAFDDFKKAYGIK